MKFAYLESLDDPVRDLVPNKDGAHQNEEESKVIWVTDEISMLISSRNINHWLFLGIAKNGIEILIHIK